MTLDEFEVLATTVLQLAAPGGEMDALSEPCRCTLLLRLLKAYRVDMPGDMALLREEQRQRREMAEAVKLAAAAGKLHTGLFTPHGEPS